MKGVMAACASDTGLVRKRNEDSYFVGGSCIAVADGMGGHNAGEVASSIAIETVESNTALLETGEMEPAECVREANLRVLEAASSDSALSGMGTTLTLAVWDDADIKVAHVGDSRAYLVSGGTIQRLTDDHSVVGEMVRSGALTPDEAHSHPGRHAITRALGFVEDLEVDQGTWGFGPGDVVLLCTDGLHDVVSDQEILEAVMAKSGDGPEAICEFLVAVAKERGGPDNITVAAAMRPS
ncbi:MAG: Stp1/IreP family PP2C-type Ser/Thr phosphatase [Bacillota bacterium]|nr:Stp1/IreP family PP2C-type Ser/Thr phosphatase [Bacillota bacterium]